jgi:putative ABC transport system permease protein
MALGIAACTLVFSIVEATAFRNRLIAHPETLVVVTATTGLECHVCVDEFSEADFKEWSASGLHSFSALAPYEALSVRFGTQAEQRTLQATRIRSDFFPVLGVRPVRGRLFDSQDDSSTQPAALISYDVWQDQFGSDKRVLGSTMLLNGEGITVIGVMPRGFAYPDGAKIWVSWPSISHPKSDDRTLMAVGRFAPNVSVVGARTELETIAKREALASSDPKSARGIAVMPMDQWARDTGASGHEILLGAVCLMFLVACVNIAGLNLVRAVGRDKEIAVRVAMGARTEQIAKQLVLESLVLVSIGAAVGIFISLRFIRVLSAFIVQRLALPAGLQIDGAVLAASAVITIVVGIAFGLTPLFHVKRIDHASVLRGASDGLTAGRTERRWRNRLVAVELAFTVVLSAGAVLFTRSDLTIRRFDLGFDASKVFLARAPFPDEQYQQPEQRYQLSKALLLTIGHPPDARGEAAWSTYTLPMTFGVSDLREAAITLEGGREIMSYRATPLMSLDGTPGTFKTLGLAIVGGRDFTDRDNASSAPVVIINEVAARAYWPGENAVGKRFKLGPVGSRNPWLTVVGVTSARTLPDPSGLTLALINPDRAWPLMFRPFAQVATASKYLTVAISADHNPARFTRSLQHAVASTLGSDTEVQYGTMLSFMRNGWLVPRVEIEAEFLVGVAVASIALALIGVQSVVVDAVQRRTREIGIRLALGATPRSVVLLVSRETLIVSACGIAAGVALTVLLVSVAGHFIFGITGGIRTGMLFGVSYRDPLLYLSVCAFLLAVMSLGTIWPALQAARVDPALSLHTE